MGGDKRGGSVRDVTHARDDGGPPPGGLPPPPPPEGIRSWIRSSSADAKSQSSEGDAFNPCGFLGAAPSTAGSPLASPSAPSTAGAGGKS